MTNAGFEELLSVGGKSNSLGKASEVLATTLSNKGFLDELYMSIKSDNPWVRMRAVDTFEKVCRVHPDWIEPYIDAIQNELSDADQQASVKWHIAEIYTQVKLTTTQQQFALQWLSNQIASTEVDWIVAVNCMKALTYFTKQGDFSKTELLRLLAIQEGHHSKAVAKKARTLRETFLV